MIAYRDGQLEFSLESEAIHLGVGCCPKVLGREKIGRWHTFLPLNVECLPAKRPEGVIVSFFEEKNRLLWWFQEVYPKLMELFALNLGTTR